MLPCLHPATGPSRIAVRPAARAGLLPRMQRNVHCTSVCRDCVWEHRPQQPSQQQQCDGSGSVPSSTSSSSSSSSSSDSSRPPMHAACRQAISRAALRLCDSAIGWVAQQQQLVRQHSGGSLPAGPGGMLAAALAVVPTLPGGGILDLVSNRVFMAGFAGWALAQCLKIFTKRMKKGVWDLRALVDSGGMPSSHSALCAGITTAIALQHGFGSTLFAVSFAFSSIVMYDAAGVRRHAGKQAEVLNQVIDELLEGHPVSAVKLKEVLGHTPLQVCAGAVLGVLFGLFYPMPVVVAA